MTRVVRSKEELKYAIKNNTDIIIVEGSLAKKVHRTQIFNKNITKVSKWQNATNISTAQAIGIASLTGIEIAVIIIAISVGLGIIISLWKDYQEIEVELKTEPPRIKFKTKKKS